MKPIVMIILACILSASCQARSTPIEPSFSFPNWQQSRKLNNAPLESDAHNAYIDIYLNDLAYSTYKNAAAPYPVGSIVYKPLYYDANRSEIARLIIMVKMPPGYDSEHGDWWYGVYDKTGTEGWYKGRIRSCIACHEHVKELDYMFSESVLYKIKHPGTSTMTTGEIIKDD